MRRCSTLIPGLLMLFFSACYKEKFNALPSVDEGNLQNTVALDSMYFSLLEGLYGWVEGDDRFGNELAARRTDGYLCLYSEKDGRFLNLKIGFRPGDSSIQMAGFWYDPILAQQGQTQFSILKEEGVRSIFALSSEGILIRGYIDQESQPITLSYRRPFSEKVRNTAFIIAAHRAGGRNADNIPYAENSLELVQHAALFGATGVEIDVRLTRDRVPIVYHDADINPRLTRKGPLVGNINQVDAEFLRAYIRLVDGQVIPTLDEMLTAIIDYTSLEHVWIDCKDGGEANFFERVLPIVSKASEYAALQGRSVSLLLGMPDQESYDRFVALPGHTAIPSLCELSLAKAKIAGSKVYAPRWTLGILEEEATEAHARGMKVITWTLDDPGGMKEILSNTAYDGILTNYPSMLAYHFYSQD